MKTSFQPILVAPFRARRKTTTFFLPTKTVEVEVPQGFADELARLCDGTRDLANVAKLLRSRWSRSERRNMLSLLRKHDVLVDGCTMHRSVWNFVTNPTRWYHDLTLKDVEKLVVDDSLHSAAQDGTRHLIRGNEWTSLLNRRETVRTFSAGPIQKQALFRLLWSGYGQLVSSPPVASTGSRVPQRRTVPSAGALYPLLMHVALFHRSGGIEPSIYQVIGMESAVRLAKVCEVGQHIRSGFVDADMLTSATGVVVVSGSFSRCAAKYSNRSLLYVPLEAGHVAQNMHLAAMHEGLATAEIGGFIEDEIRRLLLLPEGAQPLTTVVFGHSESVQRSTAARSVATRAIVDQIQFVAPQVGSYHLPFEMAFGRVISHGGSVPSWSCGRSRTREVARRKAIAEGIEWYACGRFEATSFAIERMCDLGPLAIDPKTMIRYADRTALAKGGVREFSPKRTSAWAVARSQISGRKLHVLADFVHFPYSPTIGERYAYANSSGTAAHTTIEKAKTNALLELVERDAFMIAWLNRLSCPAIPKHLLSNSFRRRIDALEKEGNRVSITALFSDIAAVPLVSLASTTKPYFTCSSACTFDVEEALDRALMEVEASYYCWQRDGGSSARYIAPEEVWWTDDHDVLYRQPRAVQRAMFLLERSGATTTLKHMEKDKPKTFTALCNWFEEHGYDVLFVELGRTDASVRTSGLRVAKAFVPGLVPMTFEYGLEALGLPRVRNLPLDVGALKKKRALSALNRFPHPYT